MIDLGKWFWSPGYGPALTYTVVAGLFLLFVCSVGTTTWWTATGPSGEIEDRIYFRSGTARRMAVWALTCSALVFPASLFISVALQVFAFSPRATVLLVSRAGAAVSAEDPVRAAWEAFARTGATTDTATVRSGDRYLDAGIVVDAVLRRVQDRGIEPGASRHALGDFARRIVVDEMEEVDVAALAVTAPADAVPGASAERSRLPDWIIESVEIAVVRLMLERVNTGRVAILSAGRRDANGQPAWRDVEGYLASSSRRAMGEDQVKIYDLASGRLAPRLVSALAIADSSSSLGLLLWIDTPARTGSQHEDRLVIRSGELATSPQLDLIDLPRATVRTLQLRRLGLPTNSIPADVRADHEFTGSHSIVKTQSATGGRKVRFLCPASWNDTYRAFNPAAAPDEAAPWWLAAARDRLFGRDGLLEHVELELGGAPEAAEVVLDGRSGRGILLYFHRDGVPAPTPPETRAVPAARRLTVWTQQVAPDAIFALSGLELPAGGFHTPSALGGAAAFGSSAAGRRLVDGVPPRQPALDPVLMTIFPDGRATTSDAGPTNSVIWIGVEPELSGLLYTPDAQGNQVRIAAFWSGVLWATQLCASRPESPNAAILESNERPLILAREPETERIAARSYAMNSGLLMAALVAAAIWWLSQAAMHRHSHD